MVTHEPDVGSRERSGIVRLKDGRICEDQRLAAAETARGD